MALITLVVKNKDVVEEEFSINKRNIVTVRKFQVERSYDDKSDYQLVEILTLSSRIKILFKVLNADPTTVTGVDIDATNILNLILDESERSAKYEINGNDNYIVTIGHEIRP